MKWIIGLYLMVRLLTVSRYPHFFDGPEYVRLAGMEWGEAMQASHLSVHPISYAVWGGVAKIWPEGGALALAMVSVGMGAVGLMVLEAYLKRWGKRARWMGGLAYIFWPLAQLIQTNVATESMTQTLLIVGLYGWWRSWREGGWWKVLGVLGVVGAIINFPGAVWWVGLLLVIGRMEGKIRQGIIAIVWSCAVAGVGLMGAYHLGGLGIERMIVLWEEHGNLVRFIHSPIEIVRVIYQASQALIYNYGWGAILVGGWLMVEKMRKGKKEDLGWMALVGAIYLMSMSYWHGGIYGRPGGVMMFVLAILLARVPKKIGLLALGISCLSWVGTVRAYQETPMAERVRVAVEEQCREAGLVVFSDLMRPQLTEVEGLVGERYIYIGPNNMTEIEEQICEVNEGGGKVCVTKEAWDYPYRQDDGQQRHPLQGGNKTGELAKRIEEKSIRLVRID